MRWKSVLVNIAVAVASLILLLLLLEGVVFRFISIPSDLPQNAYIDGVIRLAPNQTGVYRVGDEIAARYRINADGWNSGHASYPRAKRRGVKRIAIIGDSFVEALQVDFDQSLAEQLERFLGPESYEVYRFGVSGAPLSQYLHILRHEVLDFSPDLVVWLIIHNDFTASHRLELGRYTRSFLRLEIRPAAIVELEPQPYVRPWYAGLRRTALFRNLVIRRRVDIAAIKRLVFIAESRPVFQANINVQDLETEIEQARRITDYLFAAAQRLAKEHGFDLLLLMDGDRVALYEGIPAATRYAAGSLRLNALCAELAARHALAFMDLHPIFDADYAANARRFSFAGDGHWNRYGHEIAAAGIKTWLDSHPDRPDRGTRR